MAAAQLFCDPIIAPPTIHIADGKAVSVIASRLDTNRVTAPFLVIPCLTMRSATDECQTSRHDRGRLPVRVHEWMMLAQPEGSTLDQLRIIGGDIALKRSHITQEVAMETDVVCGMKVDPTKAPAQSQYQGKMYYFCSTACKAKFDASPQRYVQTEQYAKP